MNILLQQIISIDLYIHGLIKSLQNPPLTGFFKVITLLGESWVVILFVIILATFLYHKDKKTQIAELFLTVAGSVGFTYLGKIIFDRPRPEGALILETSASFPSGHATAAAALYGFLLYFLLQRTTKKTNRLLIGLGLSILIAFIGFSRLYLGVHYLSDVLAGFLVGFVWLLAGIKIIKLANKLE